MPGEGVCIVGVCMVRGACMVGEETCMVGGHVWQGACMAVGACIQQRRPLKRAVHVLLECILVLFATEHTEYFSGSLVSRSVVNPGFLR